MCVDMSEAIQPRKVKQKPSRSVEDTAAIYDILDSAYVAHVGFSDPELGETFVLPVAYARDGNRILLHGSTGSRLMRKLIDGAMVCATVTILDGMVAARTPFNSSMNYRSVMIFGKTYGIEGEAKIPALEIVSNHLIPGLWDVSREMTAKEYAQTAVIGLELDDVTAKGREGGSLDQDEADSGLWAGQIPMVTKFEAPVPNEECIEMEIPEYIAKVSQN